MKQHGRQVEGRGDPGQDSRSYQDIEINHTLREILKVTCICVPLDRGRNIEYTQESMQHGKNTQTPHTQIRDAPAAQTVVLPFTQPHEYSSLKTKWQTDTIVSVTPGINERSSLWHCQGFPRRITNKKDIWYGKCQRECQE